MDTSILIYGKPSTFEVFELKDFDLISNTNELNIVEPSIKTRKQSDGSAIRFQKKEGYYYLQLYTFAQAYGSSRPGICIGVGIKSKSKIEFSNKNISLLNDLLTVVKENVFKKNSVEFAENQLQSLINKSSILSLSSEIVSKIEFSANSQSLRNEQFLVVLENFENAIDKLPENIYDDVCIFQNQDLIKDEMNTKDNINCRNNNFYVVKENKIVKFKEEEIFVKKPTVNVKGGETNGNSKMDEILRNELDETKRKNENLENELNSTKNKIKKKVIALSLATIVFGLTTTAFFFNWYFNDDGKVEPNPELVATEITKIKGYDQAKPTIQNSNNDLVTILDNASRRDTLYNLLTNLRKDNAKKNSKVIKAILIQLGFFDIAKESNIYSDYSKINLNDLNEYNKNINGQNNKTIKNNEVAKRAKQKGENVVDKQEAKTGGTANKIKDAADKVAEEIAEQNTKKTKNETDANKVGANQDNSKPGVNTPQALPVGSASSEKKE